MTQVMTRLLRLISAMFIRHLVLESLALNFRKPLFFGHWPDNLALCQQGHTGRSHHVPGVEA